MFYQYALWIGLFTLVEKFYYAYNNNVSTVCFPQLMWYIQPENQNELTLCVKPASLRTMSVTSITFSIPANC